MLNDFMKYGCKCMEVEKNHLEQGGLDSDRQTGSVPSPVISRSEKLPPATDGNRCRNPYPYIR